MKKRLLNFLDNVDRSVAKLLAELDALRKKEVPSCGGPRIISPLLIKSSTPSSNRSNKRRQ